MSLKIPFPMHDLLLEVKMERLKGVYPALITPFTRDGKVHEESLRQLLRLNLQKGVTGFYVGGSTSEAYLLSVAERKKILEVAADEIQGKVRLIYHVGCMNTHDAAELGRFAKAVGVDAISSVPPFYYKYSFREIYDYYLEIVDRTGLPMIVYNIPELSGVSFSLADFRELAAHPLIIGIKHTSYDLFQLEQLKRLDPRLLVFNGHDEVFLAGMTMGADGAIGTTFNFMAEKFVNIARQFKMGRIEAARQIQVEANQVIALLIEVGVFQGTKYILELMGIDCGECREPFQPLDDTAKQRLREVVEAHQYFQS
jgi:N-acetylneuraminate lyase